MNRDPIIFYHEDCIDGFGAAYAAWLFLGGVGEYVPASYKTRIDFQEFIDQVKDREVYLLDFSFPKDILETALIYAKKVTWIDHHPDSIELGKKIDLGVFPYGHHFLLSPDKSGALLTKEYLLPQADTSNTLFSIIDDYDRWTLRSPDTKAIIAAITSYRPWTFSQWFREFASITMGRSGASFSQTQKYFNLKKGGEAILRYQSSLADSLVKTRAGRSSNCLPFLANEVGSKIATLTGDYGLCYQIEGEGTVKVSLRSNGFNVQEIAKKYGGNGHKTAAGFYSTIEKLPEVLKDIG